MNEQKSSAEVVIAVSKTTSKEKSPNILVIDDDRVLLDFFGKVFKKLGFQVALVDNGKEAINLARKTTLDIVLLDIKMPGIDGISVLKEIKAQDPDIEVIIMTGYASLDSALEALKYGAFDYIQKPFDKLDQVVITVGLAWERRKPRVEGRSIEASLERRIYELKVLYNSSRMIGSCSDTKEIMPQLLESLSKIIAYDVAISMLTGSVNHPVPTAESMGTEGLRSQELILQVVNSSSPSLVEEAKCNLIEAYNSTTHSKISKRIVFDKIIGEKNIKLESADGIKETQKLNSFLDIPLMSQGNIVGMINISSQRDRTFSLDDIRLIYTMVSQVPSAKHRLNEIKAGVRNRMIKWAQGMTEGVIIVDENFNVILVNEPAQKILSDENPNLESIQNTLRLDLRKLKAQTEKEEVDLVKQEAEILSQVYEVVTSVIKGTTEGFMGFVISLCKFREDEST